MVRIGEFIILATMFLFIWVPGTPFNFKQSMFVLVGIVLTLAAGELITRSCMAKYRSQLIVMMLITGRRMILKLSRLEDCSC